MFWQPIRAAGREAYFMITSDCRSMLRKPARRLLIAVLAGAAAISSIAAPVALAAKSSGNVVAAVPVDWPQAWHDRNNGAAPSSPGSGYGPAGTAVSSPATAAQSRGCLLYTSDAADE